MQLYGSAMTLTVSQFYKNNRNVIDWYPSGSGITKWNSTNVADVLTSGHNLRVELYPEIITLLSFIDRFELGYAFMNIEHRNKNGINTTFDFTRDSILLASIWVGRRPSKSEILTSRKASIDTFP